VSFLFLCSDDARVFMAPPSRFMGIAETFDSRNKSELAALDCRAVCNSQRPRMRWCRNQAEVQFGREILWRPHRGRIARVLVTNGIADTLRHRCGSQTRRYHGLLVAALQRPWPHAACLGHRRDRPLRRNGFRLATHRWGHRCRSQLFYSLRIHLAGSTRCGPTR